MKDFSALYAEADQAGREAVAKAIVEPMIVVGDKRADFIADGPCGFAWINVKPGNSAFAKWLKDQGKARKAYEGGVSVWVSDYNQSMQKKEIYAYAFAAVLQKYAIKAYASSRMD